MKSMAYIALLAMFALAPALAQTPGMEADISLLPECMWDRDTSSCALRGEQQAMKFPNATQTVQRFWYKLNYFASLCKKMADASNCNSYNSGSMCEWMPDVSACNIKYDYLFTALKGSSMCEGSMAWEELMCGLRPASDTGCAAKPKNAVQFFSPTVPPSCSFIKGSCVPGWYSDLDNNEQFRARTDKIRTRGDAQWFGACPESKALLASYGICGGKDSTTCSKSKQCGWNSMTDACTLNLYGWNQLYAGSSNEFSTAFNDANNECSVLRSELACTSYILGKPGNSQPSAARDALAQSLEKGKSAAGSATPGLRLLTLALLAAAFLLQVL